MSRMLANISSNLMDESNCCVCIRTQVVTRFAQLFYFDSIAIGIDFLSDIVQCLISVSLHVRRFCINIHRNYNQSLPLYERKLYFVPIN